MWRDLWRRKLLLRRSILWKLQSATEAKSSPQQLLQTLRSFYQSRGDRPHLCLRPEGERKTGISPVLPLAV